MATFQVSELKEAALRRLATELGIPEGGRTCPVIEQDIIQKFPHVLLMSSVLHATPPQPPAIATTKRDWLGWAALALTTITAVLTAVIAFTNWRSAVAGLQSAEAGAK